MVDLPHAVAPVKKKTYRGRSAVGFSLIVQIWTDYYSHLPSLSSSVASKYLDLYPNRTASTRPSRGLGLVMT